MGLDYSGMTVGFLIEMTTARPSSLQAYGLVTFYLRQNFLVTFYLRQNFLVTLVGDRVDRVQDTVGLGVGRPEPERGK